MEKIIAIPKEEYVNKARVLEREVRKDKRFGKKNIKFARDTVGYEGKKKMSIDELKEYCKILKNLA
jgi:hypothetical protein